MEGLWANKNLERRENMAREQDLVADADHMGLLSDVIIYICVGTVLEK